MRKKWFWLVFAVLAFVACKKYESHPSDSDTPLPHHVEPVYHIGDYYSNDTLRGVVFLTHGAHNGLLVSLEESKLPWCIPNYVNSLTGATNPYDGWRNTNIVMSNYDLNHFPAIQWSHQRNSWQMVYYSYHPITAKQWFVPSSSELCKLLQNQAAVNATLDSLGYPTLDGKVYWSSTETSTRGAAAVRLREGQVIVSDSVKNQKFYVRAIHHF